MHAMTGKRNGGEGGIRTLGTLQYTRFPGEHLRPLGHLSAEQEKYTKERFSVKGFLGGWKC